MEKKNRVFGVIGVKAEMANWNASFDGGNPKCTSDGKIFGSDKALKYAIKQQWIENGDIVLTTKTRKENKEGNLSPLTLQERYESLFGKIGKDNKGVLKNLLSIIDTLTFGTLFAVSGANHSITGVVQINQGLNKYKNTEVMTQDIIAPFRNPDKSNENSVQTTIGKMVIVDEAHYCYSFSVNPSVCREYKNIFGEEFKGYTEEAYEKFKGAALSAVTGLNSASKAGCINEYAIFINLKEGSKKMLPKFDSFVTIEKDEKDEKDEKTIININKAKNLLEAFKNEINNIEIYYDNELTEIEYDELTEDVKNLIIENILYQ